MSQCSIITAYDLLEFQRPSDIDARTLTIQYEYINQQLNKQKKNKSTLENADKILKFLHNIEKNITRCSKEQKEDLFLILEQTFTLNNSFDKTTLAMIAALVKKKRQHKTETT